MPTAVQKSSIQVALIGNPNTGKSTLFNALAGAHAHTGNYPGVTVEKKIGRVRWDGRAIDLIDLPGTYSLAPRSLDEMVSVDVLLGRQAEIGAVDAVICILDAGNLERNLYLVSQVLDLGLPTVVVLNMWDLAAARGMEIDTGALAQRLGVPVVTTSAHRQDGVAGVRKALEQVLASGPHAPVTVFPPAFRDEAARLRARFAEWQLPVPPEFLCTRLLLDVGGYLERHLGGAHTPELVAELHQARERLAGQNLRVPALEARVRYQWVRTALEGIIKQPRMRGVTTSDRIDRYLTHRLTGLLVFAALMFLVFQSIYSWAEPLMNVCSAVQDGVAAVVQGHLPPGPLRSLLIDGVIAGVGGVLVFLPQIVLLFIFIAALEDCGYMARAAFLMDKLMTRIGLSGKSFVPLMSSFACAIPGVMATRTIENRRDRMVTILVAPLMSCSARLPVYLLLIGAFIPDATWWGGWVSARGSVLFGMYAVGALVAIPVAWLLKQTFFRGETPPFVMELPSYKWPSAWVVGRRVYDQAAAFVVRAGTLIFMTSVLVWAAGYFPGDHREADRLQAEIERLERTVADADRAPELGALRQRENQATSALLQASLLGTLGRWCEPLVRPLGWDWRIGVGVIASFPAREVVIATLGTLYSLGGDVSESDPSLREALRQVTWPDGEPVYNIPVALSIMVFFALCAQCASTLMVIRRETNSWRWPAFTFAYMTLLAYVAACATYQIGIRL